MDGTRFVEMGPGLQLLRLRMAPRDVVVLGGILAGYDGLASIHGDETGVVVLLATDDTIDELDALVDALAETIPLERLDARTRAPA